MENSKKSVKEILLSAAEGIKGKLEGFKGKYGILGIAALVCLLIKYGVFYYLMSVRANVVLVYLVSLVITYYLFAAFKNKYIPAVIYLVLSVLMFADVTYCSFFNKYLSVNMIGSAGMLGDITASIKEVVKIVNFAMFVDAILILAAVIKAGRGKGKEDTKTTEMKETEVVQPQVIKFIEIKDEKPKGQRDILAELDAMEESDNQEELKVDRLQGFSFSQSEDEYGKSLQSEHKEAEVAEETAAKDAASYPSCETVLSRVRRKQKERRHKRERIWRIFDFKEKIIPVLLIALLVFLGIFSPFFQSISRQEFFTYHVGDMVTEGLGIGNSSSLIAFEDNYEKEKEGPYFGIGKGRNLVVIQVESYQNFLIGLNYNGQEITPFLNSLIKEDTAYFDNYYQQLGTGNTSDAEFATNNSIMGSIEAFTYQIYEKNYFRGLPWLLKDLGYYTAVLHAHENRAFWNRDDIYGQLGFDDYFGGLIGDKARPGGNFTMTEWMGWGLTDSEFYPQAMEYIKKFKQPFYSFIITLSNHHPYEMLDKYNFITLKDEDKGTIAGNYINSAAYTDYALKELFDLFKKEGLYENTVFAIYGDHMGLPDDPEINEVMGRVLGHDYDWDDRMNIPLIIHVPGAPDDFTKTIDHQGGQVDFLPTIAYIMGLDHLDTIYLGHNLFNYEDQVVAEHAYMPYGSFFTKDACFEMSRDGIFQNGRAWSRSTRKELPLEGLYEYYERSKAMSDTSIYILKNDVLRQVYVEGKSRSEVFE